MERLLKVLKKAGASRLLLVGGAVIDSIQGREPKDLDIEVYGLSLESIQEALETEGIKFSLAGASFGILKVEGDIDLSVPRTENKVGIGHKDFNVQVDADLTPSEAAERRDLTINTLFQDLETGEVFSPFGGLEDLEAGILRATNPSKFVEDPLRVLRVMQLLPRKGKVVSPETMELCKSMVSEFPSLPRERVFEEFAKLLMKAERPSVGLRFLRDCGWLVHFPELGDLVGCPQNPEWHPEGDVWEHTLLSVDAAAAMKGNLPEEWQLPFMLGMLCHDMGKPMTTTEDLTSHGHDVAGEEPARGFLSRITGDKTLTERVVLVVVHHMRCGALSRAGAKDSAWQRLHNDLRLDVAAYVSKADKLACLGTGVHEPSLKALELFAQLGAEKVQPLLDGKFLISKGVKPGKEMGALLKAAYEYQIESGAKTPEEVWEYIRRR